MSGADCAGQAIVGDCRQAVCLLFRQAGISGDDADRCVPACISFTAFGGSRPARVLAKESERVLKATGGGAWTGDDSSVSWVDDLANGIDRNYCAHEDSAATIFAGRPDAAF